MGDDPTQFEQRAPGPFLTIRAGGPLQGVVTLTTVEHGHGRSVIEASWVQDGHGYSDTVEVDEFEQARALAEQIADQFAAGIAPDLSRD